MTGISVSFPADGLPVRQLAGALAPVLYSNRERSVLTSVAMEPAGGRPTSPAGSLLLGASAFFAVASLILISGPVPGMEIPDRGRIVMGMVYGIISGLFFLAPISVPMWTKLEAVLIAWAKRRQWSKRELRALVAQLEGAA